MATAQLKIPAMPPANRMLGMLSSLWLPKKNKQPQSTFAERADEQGKTILTLSPAE